MRGQHARRWKVVAATVAVSAATAAFAAASPAGGIPTVAVKETNFKLSLSAKPKAGKVRFVVTNRSNLPHDFWIQGGGIKRKTPKLAPGKRAVLTVTLRRGATYRVWCGVGGHATAGMAARFVAR